MIDLENRDKYVYDIEIYPNYFCVVLKALNKDRMYIIDTYNFLEKREQLYNIIKNYILISYGGHSFDDRVLEFLYTLKDKKHLNFNEIHKRIIRINRYRLEKKENFVVNSLDILREFKCDVGIKGFTFNLGENIVDHTKDFNKPIQENETKSVINYCTSDVVQTEKLYNMIMKENEDVWYEKEFLLKNLIKIKLNLYNTKDRMFYLSHTNEELVSLFLKEKNRNYVKRFFSLRKQYDKFRNISNKYGNKRKKKVFLLTLDEDYFYKILYYLEEKKIFTLKNVNLGKFDYFIEKYKKNLYDILTNPNSLVYDKNESKYIIKLRNVILKRINKLCKKYKSQIFKIKENYIFIDKINKRDLKKFTMEINEIFKYTFNFNISEVDKFIRLNDNTQDCYAEIGNKIIADDFFIESKFLNPSKNSWLGETLKLHYLQKMKVEAAIQKMFEEKPHLFFLYYTANSKVNKCTINGEILNETYLETSKKYRVYYSKTGYFKPIDRRNFNQKNPNSLKYYKKFAIGDINSKYFKMRTLDIDTKNFSEYQDIDLKSYIYYAKEFIKKQ